MTEHIYSPDMKQRKNSSAARMFRQYFPIVMLILMSGTLSCVVAYNFYQISFLWQILALLIILASLLAGAQLAQTAHKETENKQPQPRNNREAGYFLGQPDKRLTLASLAALLHEGVAILRNGRFVYANPALAYMLGAQEEELLGAHISHYINPEDATLLRLDSKEVQINSVSNAPTRSTLRLSTNLGDMRWVICSVHKTFWEEFEVILLLFEDIDTLKYTQMALQEQEQQSRILLERTPLGIAMFNAMGQINLSNTAWRSTWSNLLPTARRFNILQDPFMPGSNVERAIRQAFSKQEADIHHYEYNTSWGETRWLNLHFHPMLTPLDQLIGVAMVQQDITELVRAERRDNDLNEQISTLFMDLSAAGMQTAQLADLSRNILIGLDGNARINIWNKWAEQRFNLSKNQVIGHPYTKFEAQLSPYFLYLGKMPEDRHLEETGGMLARQDTLGERYERPRLFSPHKNMRILFVDDITVRVYSERTHRLLAWVGSLACHYGTMDAAGNNPAIAALITDFKTNEANPLLPDPLTAGLLLDSTAACIKENLGENADIILRTGQPDVCVRASADLHGRALAEWALLLARAARNGTPKIELNQGSENGYAVINLFCGTTRLKDLPLKELWQPGEMPRLSINLDPARLAEYNAFPLRSFLNLSETSGILGLYPGLEGGAGVTWRLPIAV